MPSTMLRKSLDPYGEFDSPLCQNRIDRGYENLEVRVLHYPNENDWKMTATLAGAGHAGAGFNPVEYLDKHTIDEILVSDLWKGGLGQVKESDNVTFLIYGCSRGVTHELVRTRQAWFVQQTFRHTNCSNQNLRMPEEIMNSSKYIQDMWIKSVRQSVRIYNTLVDFDLPYQDARTVLPIATETWIIAGYPVKTWLDTYAYRATYMFYPEISWLFREMKQKLMEVCPFIAEQALMTCEKTHVCEYQGVESTNEMCPMPWAHIRRWKSDRFSSINSKDVKLEEHNASVCNICLQWSNH